MLGTQRPKAVPRQYVSGLWILPSNPKYTSRHYLDLLPATIAMLRGQTLLFHSNDEAVLDRAGVIAIEHGVTFEGVTCPVADLPARDAAQALVESCAAMQLDLFPRPSDFFNEKGVVHYWRDLKGGGADIYRDMLTIWLSKIPISAGVARDRDRSVAWVDASIARVNGKRENWDFSRVDGVPGRISHYGSPMRHFGRTLPLSAGYLEGDPEAWTMLRTLYTDALERAAQSPYGHDEETILGHCVSERPDLFHCVGRPLGPPPPGLRACLGALRRRLKARSGSNRGGRH